MNNFFKKTKELLGMEEIDEREDIYEEDLFEDSKQEEKSKDKNKNRKQVKGKRNNQLSVEDELLLNNAAEEKVEEVPVKTEEERYQTIFVDPKEFSECKKIANYIRNDQMVTLNLEYLDTEKAQRMMDFLMGAMLVKGASFIEISKKVYTSVPKSVKVHYEGKKDLNGKFYNGSEEDGNK